MKKHTLALAIAGVLALTACKEDKAADAANPVADKPAAEQTASAKPVQAGDVTLSSQAEKVSYILGLNIGGQFKANEIELEEKSFLAGVKAAIAEQDPAMSQEEIQATMTAFQQEMIKKHEEAEKKREAEAAEVGKKNQEEGAKFLAENGKRDGVKTTSSGLQYEIVEEGKGAKPTADDTVTVHYKGTLIDGTEFDSSFKRNEPATFAVNAVIPGWVEALQLMNEGSKYKLYIPSDLAYGPGGTGGEIGPNATLIFEVELIKVEKAAPIAEVKPIDASSLTAEPTKAAE